MTTLFEFRPVLFAVFWKSGIALGAALCISRMLRNRSADLRRLVFSTTIVAMFVAAAATPVLPRWTAVTPLWFPFQRPAPAMLNGTAIAANPMNSTGGCMTIQRFCRSGFRPRPSAGGVAGAPGNISHTERKGDRTTTRRIRNASTVMNTAITGDSIPLLFVER